MKRLFDIFFSLLLIIILLPVFIIISLLIKIESKGPIIHLSKRVGQKTKIFNMPKFRTMKLDCPNVATHLLTNPDQWLTQIGKLLRKSSLDEIPQLISILIGQMTFVGPRPALYNQDDLITKREKLGINHLKPGLTGWAQINGRDEISIDQKVQLDLYYLKNYSLHLDLKILFLTFWRALSKDNISH